MPNSALTAEQKRTNNHTSVKNHLAPAQLNRLRGRAGSRGLGLGKEAAGGSVGAPALPGSPGFGGEVCTGPSPEASGCQEAGGQGASLEAPRGHSHCPSPLQAGARVRAGAGVGIGIQEADHKGAGGVRAVQEGARGWALVPAGVSARMPQAALGGPPPWRVRHRVLVSQGPSSSLARGEPHSAAHPEAQGGGGAGPALSLGFGLKAEACGEREEMASLGADLLGTVPRACLGSPGSYCPVTTAWWPVLCLPGSTLILGPCS